jgi:hypothetical protein
MDCGEGEEGTVALGRERACGVNGKGTVHRRRSSWNKLCAFLDFTPWGLGEKKNLKENATTRGTVRQM